MDVPADMVAAGVEFAAAEHADQAKVAKKVEAMNEATAPAAEPGEVAPSSPAPAAAAATEVPAELPEQQAKELLLSIIAVADRFVVGFTTPQLALLPAEQEQIATKAVPVLNKHLPDIIKMLAGTVEGQLVLTVGLIYASKAPALLGGKKTETPATSPTEAKA